jgi:hypothetical protein
MAGEDIRISATPPPGAASIRDGASSGTIVPARKKRGVVERIVRILLLFLVLIPVAFLALALFINSPRAREQRRRAEEAHSIQVLAKAQTPAELQEAVGDLGIVFHTRDGGWIAVRYVDTHAGPIWSSSVARDSGGHWFVSSYHFCGRFQFYRQDREKDQPSGLRPELAAIDRCDTLDEARELLLGLGFQEVIPPAAGGEAN